MQEQRKELAQGSLKARVRPLLSPYHILLRHPQYSRCACCYAIPGTHVAYAAMLRVVLTQRTPLRAALYLHGVCNATGRSTERVGMGVPGGAAVHDAGVERGAADPVAVQGLDARQVAQDRDR
eukprot:1835690-Rhodomonas_salina.1